MMQLWFEEGKSRVGLGSCAPALSSSTGQHSSSSSLNPSPTTAFHPQEIISFVIPNIGYPSDVETYISPLQQGSNRRLGSFARAEVRSLNRPENIVMEAVEAPMPIGEGWFYSYIE
jgi:hypothetical protein